MDQSRRTRARDAAFRFRDIALPGLRPLGRQRDRPRRRAADPRAARPRARRRRLDRRLRRGPAGHRQPVRLAARPEHWSHGSASAVRSRRWAHWTRSRWPPPPSPTRSLALGLAVIFSGMTWTVFLMARQGYLIDAVPLAYRARAMSGLGGDAGRRADRPAARRRPHPPRRADLGVLARRRDVADLGPAGAVHARLRLGAPRRPPRTPRSSRCSRRTAAPCSRWASPS